MKICKPIVKATRKDMEAEVIPHFTPKWGAWLPEEGWWDIILDTHRKIRAIYPEYQIYQIKDKFGSLRYYIKSVPPVHDMGKKIRAIIEEAELLSSKTCLTCGRKGHMRNIKYWTYTLCNYHMFLSWKRSWARRMLYKISKLNIKSHTH